MINIHTIDLTTDDSTIEVKNMPSQEKKTSYIAEVVEVTKDGDAIIDLPEEMLRDLGWKEGDTLDLSMDDGKIIVKKVVV